MRSYICIDLKSFYASAECIARGVDPLNTHLVVADSNRTDKTICLAVSPSLKAIGVPGRPRLFEVVQIVKEYNRKRLAHTRLETFEAQSVIPTELAANPKLELSYIVAEPRMALYKKVSNQIYEIYLRYIAPEDIHIYSIDEAFIDVTDYLQTYRCTARALAMRMIRDVLKETGITATAGVGTNLYLAKIAMDIVAKKMSADKDGVRIAELDEISFRQQLWDHRPLTDFWSTGPGTEKKLNAMHLYTMGDIARFSEYGEHELFKAFGVKAELMIDHAWGYEPCTIADIKAYVPKKHSVSQGQVLKRPYCMDDARLIVKEMTEYLMLELVSKRLVTEKVELRIGYDHEGVPHDYDGEYEKDRYNRKIPKSVHGSMLLKRQTASAKLAIQAMLQIFDRIVNPLLWIRRINVVAIDVIPESQAAEKPIQYGLFDDIETLEAKRQQQDEKLKKEYALQKTMLSIKSRYGKNAILKCMNFQKHSTAIERNGQVGGHKA